MPCYLAVSITKAAVTEEALVKLLSANHKDVMQVLLRYFQEKYPNLFVRLRNGRLFIEDSELSLSDGQLTERAAVGETPYVMEAMELVQMLANKLFTDEVERVLRQTAEEIQVWGKQVNNGGEIVDATEFSVALNGLKMRVYVLPGGQVQILVDSGSFNQAEAATLLLLENLEAEDVSVVRTSEIEQHIPGGLDHVHVHTQTN